MTMKKGQEEKVKSRRILCIDEELRSGKKVTLASLVKRCEGVSARTIQRDIEFMRDFNNAPIVYDRETRSYRYSEPNFFIKTVQMTEGELFSVALFDRLLEQYRNTPLENNLRNVFRKIISGMPDEITIDSSFLENRTTFIPDQGPKIEPEVFPKVFEALKGHKTLEFEYRPLQKLSYMSRLLDPYHAVCQKGNWYIIGFCHDKGDVRVFSYSRMKDVRITKDSFKIPDTFKPEDYFDKEIGVWLSARQKHTVELLISKEIGTFAIDRTWHSNQQLKQNKDGSVRVSFETTQLPEVKRWVLGQGSTVKVLGPKELQEDVCREAVKMQGMYEK